jgi:hypothetical protein
VLQNTGSDLATTFSMNGMSASDGSFPANACREGKYFFNMKNVLFEVLNTQKKV